jgi:hypothetical protein
VFQAIQESKYSNERRKQMLKIAGALWIYMIAFYGVITINQNDPELGTPMIIIGTIIGLGLLIKWSR